MRGGGMPALVPLSSAVVVGTGMRVGMMRGCPPSGVAVRSGDGRVIPGISVGAVDDGEFHQLPLLQLVLTVGLWRGGNETHNKAAHNT
ncbi:hypothetical protein E2C01_016734 [Portunus trituberculatus]|uniref:Secreted protein n=1 Tax=Portunus trituberculatus TaxID=210409 RepID=A0A5B7DR05_PORTR|nr:hypothetical protein [Portunus trituberculatus]